MTDIEQHLESLGLQQYLQVLIQEGFDSWETLLDIQESDLEALGFKLGHRRKLQRAIADFRSTSRNGLPDPVLRESYPQDVFRPNRVTPHTDSDGKDIGVPVLGETKRRYRRHPRPDENAPDKPPSAYVLFSNRVREEVKADNLSFTEIARLVGERWQKLDATQKEPYESQAVSLKNVYNTSLAAYKRTDASQEYDRYLADFRAKQNTLPNPKRPKLVAESSSSISATSAVDYTDLSFASMQQGYGGFSTYPDVTPRAKQSDSSVMPGISSLTSFLIGNPRGGTHVMNIPAGLERVQQPSGNIPSQEKPTFIDVTEPLTRTATLSLSTPQGTPIRTPPSSAFMYRSPQLEAGLHSFSEQRVSPSFALTQESRHQPSSSSASVSPYSAIHQIEQPLDLLETKDETYMQKVNVQPILATSSSSGLEVSRMLPPLHQITGSRNIPFSPTPNPHAGGVSALSTMSRQDSRIDMTSGDASRPEDDAASTLAGLAERHYIYTHRSTPSSRAERQ